MFTQGNSALTVAARTIEDGLTAAENTSRAARMGIILPQQNAILNGNEQIISANQYPLPESVTVQVASATGAGAAPTDVFLLNQDILSDVTNNGSGAGSITYAYQDSFSGKLLSALLSNARAGMGAICYGVAIRMDVTGGAGDAAGLSATNPFFITRNAFGRSSSLDLNGTDNQTRADQDTSIMQWNIVQNIGRFVQFGFTMPVGDTATVTFYFNPNFRR